MSLNNLQRLLWVIFSLKNKTHDFLLLLPILILVVSIPHSLTCFWLTAATYLPPLLPTRSRANPIYPKWTSWSPLQYCWLPTRSWASLAFTLPLRIPLFCPSWVLFDFYPQCIALPPCLPSCLPPLTSSTLMSSCLLLLFSAPKKLFSQAILFSCL